MAGSPTVPTTRMGGAPAPVGTGTGLDAAGQSAQLFTPVPRRGPKVGAAAMISASAAAASSSVSRSGESAQLTMTWASLELS